MSRDRPVASVKPTCESALVNALRVITIGRVPWISVAIGRIPVIWVTPVRVAVIEWITEATDIEIHAATMPVAIMTIAAMPVAVGTGISISTMTSLSIDGRGERQ